MIATALLSLSIAHADVAIPPPADQQFVSHDLVVQGLEAHPDAVLLVLDRGATVSAYRAFHAGAETRQTLATGGRNRGGGISAPSLLLMPKAAYEAWQAQAMADVRAQREACSSRGEGCSHISRFVPRYPAPTGTIDCGLSLTLVTTGPERGPDTIVETVALTAATATRCAVEAKGRTAEQDGEPMETGGCSTAGGAVSLGAGLALLGLVSRRRRDAPPPR